MPAAKLVTSARRGAQWLPVALLAGLGLFAFVWMAERGNMRGSAYPKFSSLRVDPEGTKALFVALERTPGWQASRNFRNPQAFTPGNSTVMLLNLPAFAFTWGTGGLPLEEDEEEEAKAKQAPSDEEAGEKSDASPGAAPQDPAATPPKQSREKPGPQLRGNRRRPQPAIKDWRDWAENGARVVLGLSEWALDEQAELERLRKLQQAGIIGRKRKLELPTGLPLALTELGFRMKLERRKRPAKLIDPADNLPESEAQEGTNDDGADELFWSFQPIDESWQVLRQDSEQRIVAMQRRMGKGSIVLLNHDQALLLANLALAKDAEGSAELAAEALGPPGPIIFDEFHLGSEEAGGTAMLIRRYGLAPAFGLLLVTMMLYCWRSASSLLPPHEAPPDIGEPGAGGRALARLLEKRTARGEAFTLCWEEWQKAKRLLPAWMVTQESKLVTCQNATQPEADRFRAVQQTLVANRPHQHSPAKRA